MEIATIVNRTEDDLEFMYDGRVYLVPVGESHHEAVAAQHGYNKLIRGLDPTTLHATHLIGIKGKTDCSPLSVGAKPADEELLDRSKMSVKVSAVKVGGGEIAVEGSTPDMGRVGATGSDD